MKLFEVKLVSPFSGWEYFPLTSLPPSHAYVWCSISEEACLCPSLSFSQRRGFI